MAGSSRHVARVYARKETVMRLVLERYQAEIVTDEGKIIRPSVARLECGHHIPIPPAEREGRSWSAGRLVVCPICRVKNAKILAGIRVLPKGENPCPES